MTTAAEIDAIKRDIGALRELLDKEFEALKNQQFDAFEQYMNDKAVILTRISQSSILERLKTRSEQTSGYDEDSRTLDILHSALAECKNLHNRNEVLIRHKILAIRETLDSFPWRTIRWRRPTTALVTSIRVSASARAISRSLSRSLPRSLPLRKRLIPEPVGPGQYNRHHLKQILRHLFIKTDIVQQLRELWVSQYGNIQLPRLLAEHRRVFSPRLGHNLGCFEVPVFDGNGFVVESVVHASTLKLLFSIDSRAETGGLSP